MRMGNRTQPPVHQYNGTTSSPGAKGSRGKMSNGDSSLRPETNGSYTNGDLFANRAFLSDTFHGHDRGELTRLLIQSLKDMGYEGAAGALSKESGYGLENPTITSFRETVLEGNWDEARKLLFGTNNGVGAGRDATGDMSRSTSARSKPATPSYSGFTLAHGANPQEMLFWILKQKFLELLEAQDRAAAMRVLQEEIQPLGPTPDVQRHLSALIFTSPEDLRARAQWDGAKGNSRAELLSTLSQSISPSVMIPEHRLATLLTEIKQTWIDECRYHNTSASPSLFFDHKCDRSGFPSRPHTELARHRDEVWYLKYSNDGTRLASASKDKTVIIYDTEDRYKPRFRLEMHASGVSHVAWSPDDSKLITCSAASECSAKLWDMTTGEYISTIHAFTYPCTAAAFMPDGNQVVIGSQDTKHGLCLWDLEGNLIHNFAEEKENIRINDLAISSDGRRLVGLLERRIIVFSLETYDRVYDTTYDRFDVQGLPSIKHFTSVSISKDSQHMLISVNEDHIMLTEIDTGKVLRIFSGHKQEQFIIRSSFGGANESFVVSGSEDSKIYVWRTNGTLVEVLDGHPNGCVNALAWHPKDPTVFASAGDDNKVRIWRPEASGAARGDSGAATNGSSH